MFDYNPVYYPYIILLVLIPVFGFAAVYAVIAFRQLLIADKEEDKTRRQSAIKILLVTFSVMIAVVFIGYYIVK